MSTAIVTKLLRYAASLVIAYMGGVGFVFLFRAEPTLVEIVSSCKIVSLLILIYANREIPESVDMRRHAGVARVNFLIIVFSGLILVMMVVKTVAADYASMAFPPRGEMAISLFSRNSYWLSVAPIFAYFMLDVWLAFVRRDAIATDHDNAMEFVVFRDLVCVAPLALVLALAEIYSTFARVPDARASAEFFFSGALAVILLSSAIATKALNLVHEERGHAVTPTAMAPRALPEPSASERMRAVRNG
ncbi:MAG: hypothetical protein EA355_02340 [Rhodobacteraceae bacterium]|nr:MAG: hypothetical protein EA355_02340 [Paracoccaceae bacterium]